MASSAARSPSTLPRPHQTGRWQRWALAPGVALERWLEAEREQLILWLPVAMGAGIATWMALPDRYGWTVALLLAVGTSAAALAAGRYGRLSRAVGVGALAFALGLALIWWRAETVATPVLMRATVATFTAQVTRVDEMAARGLIRLRLRPVAAPDLPALVQVNIAAGDAPAALAPGAVVRLRARLTPPPPPAVPGAYDFARVAWFAGIGATGRALPPVVLVTPAPDGAWTTLRARLSAHIRASAPGGVGAVAAALATGDQGAIPIDDADAMRQAGLAHLLSVSGLHITAVVAGVMVVVSRLLALFPWLALRVRLPLVAAAAGALAAIGYTQLTGAEVPTVRSCVAALLVLVALVLGREAMTLRLVAAGAVTVLLVLPEALLGPSFQLSFAAVTAIIALHQSRPMRRWTEPREEGRGRRLARAIATLLLTGLAVEAALAPIGFYHFHRTGLYGSVANIVAIPLTTFAIMPAEALALAADSVGLGAPFWWLTARLIGLLLWIAHTTAALPGAVAALPVMPDAAFALMIGGALWLGLWQSRWRALGLPPMLAGALWAALTPAPDIVVTGDGRHAGFRLPSGDVALLRDRAGDYTAAMLTETSGVIGLPHLISDQPNARCTADLCLVNQRGQGRADARSWRVIATRSGYRVAWTELTAACAAADIAISDRRLPRGCVPRWLKLDRPTLSQTGGVAIMLASATVRTALIPGDEHPWRRPPLIGAAFSRSGGAVRPAYPAPAPGADDNAADHKPGSRDRAGSLRPPDGNI